MKTANVQSSEGVTLVGAGSVSPQNLQNACALAPTIVAADGGANRCLAMGITPGAVIGDFDSLDQGTRKAFETADFIHVAEQDTTDFEKCLTRINAPYVLATGFAAPRLDHTLAVFSVLARRVGPPTIVLGEDDIIFAAPGKVSLDLPAGLRLSLFPLAPTSGQSSGLKWPIDELTLDPMGMVGTSNVTTGPVDLAFDKPGCLVLMPPEALKPVLHALAAPPSVPAR